MRSERRGNDARETEDDRRARNLQDAQGRGRAGVRTNKERRGLRGFLMRGREKVAAEWQIICLTHNLLKLFGANCARNCLKTCKSDA